MVLLSTKDKTVIGFVTMAEGFVGGVEICGCSDLASIEITDTLGWPTFVIVVGVPILMGHGVLFESEVDTIEGFDAFNADDAIAITVSAAAFATSFERGVLEK